MNMNWKLSLSPLLLVALAGCDRENNGYGADGYRENGAPAIPAQQAPPTPPTGLDERARPQDGADAQPGESPRQTPNRQTRSGQPVDASASRERAHGHDAQEAQTTRVDEAVAVLVPVGDSGVEGTIRFERADDGKVEVTGEVRGLTPGKHGFHVHQFGDLSDRQEGKSAGDHFAGGTEHHGAPDAERRHAGDLGNIVAGEDGVAKIEMTDAVISLSGPHSILGRAVVVHAGEDKFTQPSGDAGGRVAFGVVGISKK